MSSQVPVVDVFAGCGGLSEGFSSSPGSGFFDIRLALDSDPAATESHRLRSFFYQFKHGKVPDDYYSFLRGEIPLEELYARHQKQAETAKERIVEWELGSESCPDAQLHRMIDMALDGHRDWVLIGGPPCQAYSIAGRSRRAGSDYDAESDHRNFLYREYLKILAQHRPAVFVMENVPGMLNARIKGRHVWQLMIDDLIDPSAALSLEHHSDTGDRRYDGYRIYSLATEDRGLDIFGIPQIDRDEYVVECEKYGIPQSRHRVLLFGVRADIDLKPKCLTPHYTQVTAGEVLADLPRLRSGLTKTNDTAENWLKVVEGTASAPWSKKFEDPDGVVEEIKRTVARLKRPRQGRGGEFVSVKNRKKPNYREDWFWDSLLGGVCNHETRAHMESDLHRYMFAACYAKVAGKDLRLAHFPPQLLPQHKNVKASEVTTSHFADRFSVQQMDRPSRTVVSHIAKDGHYYIHPDPTQCRSLTVREAARLQTFPDNFYFIGNRSEQYRQVGNAVPPLLAFQLAEIVKELLERHQGLN